jgi:cobalt-zinc-cadmium efflux system outer membrane protein
MLVIRRLPLSFPSTVVRLGASALALTVIVQAAAMAQQLTVANVPAPSSALVLTPDRAVEEAVKNNLSLLAEQLNLSIAEAELITARLRPNPVFSFSSDHLDLLGSGFNQSNGGGPPEYSWRVDLPIERGRKRELRIEHARFAREIAEAQLLDSVRKLVLDVKQAVVDVLLARARLNLARENLVTLEQVVNLNTVRVNAGAVAPLELTRSRVAMLQFSSNVKRSELELATAKTRLQNLLGRKPVDAFDIIGDLQSNPARVDLSDLEAAALALRPDLQALERTQALSQTNLKLQAAQGKVDYLAGAEYRRSQGINGRYNSLGFFFSVPLPLFNRNQGEIARVAAEQEKIIRQMRALKADVLAEVKRSYQEIENSRELLDNIERELLKPAAQALDTVTYTYRAGAATLMEFLDAQRSYNETMQSYYEAQAAYRRAANQINAVTGKEVTR